MKVIGKVLNQPYEVKKAYIRHCIDELGKMNKGLGPNPRFKYDTILLYEVLHNAQFDKWAVG